MMLAHRGYDVHLSRTPSPTTMAWWWQIRTEQGCELIERSARAFPTRREAKDAAWRAFRRLMAGAAKGGRDRPATTPAGGDEIERIEAALSVLLTEIVRQDGLQIASLGLTFIQTSSISQVAPGRVSSHDCGRRRFFGVYLLLDTIRARSGEHRIRTGGNRFVAWRTASANAPNGRRSSASTS